MMRSYSISRSSPQDTHRGVMGEGILVNDDAVCLIRRLIEPLNGD